LKLRLVCIGKLSSRYLKEGVADFTQRIGRYLPLEVVELREEKTGGKLAPEATREAEGERLLARTGARDWVVALDEKGRLLDSVGLAGLIERHMLEATPAVTAVLGGAYGLSDAVRHRADLILSLSPLTFTHQLARLIWLEQLYRSLTIIRNEPYHNA